MINSLGWLFGLICLIVSVCIILYERKKIRNIMENLDNMLNCAINGNFKESVFDESLLSSLEIKFANYLSSSELSAKNVLREKECLNSLIADISHQTKTPIANMLLYTELLAEEKTTAECNGYLSVLHTQTEKLSFLIDSMIKLSRLENGIISLYPQKVPLKTILSQAEQQFVCKATDKNLSFQVEKTEEFAFCDSKWTTEAICNLVDNAIKYTENGSISISVTPYEMFVCVNISDTGIGISEEEQPKIFSRFYRSEINSQQEGVGIGLYLARKIIQNQGGYIKLSSKDGKGSVFSVFLPKSI